MNSETTYHGSCFCNAVQFTVTGKPALQGYCHCDSCRKWSAGPVNAFTMWAPESVHITKGEDKVETFNKSPKSYRSWCKVCGGHVFTKHPTLHLTDVYASAIPDFPFEPGVHLHYQETVLHMHDGLTKMKDLPKEAGGSGEQLPE